MDPHSIWKSDAVAYTTGTPKGGTVGAAEDGITSFHAVADDFAVAVRADRGKEVDGAFEGVEDEVFSAGDDFEGFIIFVSAGGTFTHKRPFG